MCVREIEREIVSVYERDRVCVREREKEARESMTGHGRVKSVFLHRRETKKNRTYVHARKNRVSESEGKRTRV